ncbi:hypothetical protein [Lentzea sp. NPDC059081]|uniref:hypothetical protein n=1 Tax=Lentzea sp. NPDC059081 TaxID=3346719 RepID=UPI0036AC5F0F
MSDLSAQSFSDHNVTLTDDAVLSEETLRQPSPIKDSRASLAKIRDIEELDFVVVGVTRHRCGRPSLLPVRPQSEPLVADAVTLGVTDLSVFAVVAGGMSGDG